MVLGFPTKRKSAAHQSGQVGAVIIGGHFQGLGLLRSLGRHDVPTYLIDREQCIARFSRYTDRFSKCPDILKEEPLFLQFLLDLAVKENLRGWLLYPNDDETVRLLAMQRDKLQEYYRVTTPPWDIVKYAYDKMLTYELAKKCGIPIPNTYYPTSTEELEQLEVEFPAIIKPSIKMPFYKRTKKKAIRINDRLELLKKYRKASMLIEDSQAIMLQELIPGTARNLYSVGSLSKNGELLAKLVVRRSRQHPMDFGHATTFAQTVHIPELEEMAGKILGTMGYQGLSEVEFMFDPRDGKYKLLEINARAWGWHTIAIAAGLDMPYLSYLDTLGETVRQDGCTNGVKWIRLTTDIPIALIELLKGRLKLSEYLDSIKGKKQFAVFSREDLIPSLVELVMLPYLLKKKGF